MRYKKYINKETVRRSKPTALSEAIQQMFDAFDLRKQVDEASVKASWEKVMGKTIASRTTKLFFKDQKLIIEVNSSPLKQELILSKDKIIELFRKEFGSEVVKDFVVL